MICEVSGPLISKHVLLPAWLDNQARIASGLVVAGSCLTVMLVFLSCGELPDEPARDNHADVLNPNRDETPPVVSSMVPTPANGASNIRNPVEFSWTPATDAQSGVLEYRVFWGFQNPPSYELYTGPGLSCQYPGMLYHSIPIYWRVVAVDVAGNAAASPVWSFMVLPY